VVQSKASNHPDLLKQTNHCYTLKFFLITIISFPWSSVYHCTTPVNKTSCRISWRNRRTGIEEYYFTRPPHWLDFVPIISKQNKIDEKLNNITIQVSLKTVSEIKCISAQGISQKKAKFIRGRRLCLEVGLIKISLYLLDKVSTKYTNLFFFSFKLSTSFLSYSILFLKKFLILYFIL
jgi:hypothetical protein